MRLPLTPRGRPHTYKFILPSVDWRPARAPGGEPGLFSFYILLDSSAFSNNLVTKFSWAAQLFQGNVGAWWSLKHGKTQENFSSQEILCSLRKFKSGTVAVVPLKQVKSHICQSEKDFWSPELRLRPQMSLLLPKKKRKSQSSFVRI